MTHRQPFLVPCRSCYCDIVITSNPAAEMGRNGPRVQNRLRWPGLAASGECCHGAFTFPGVVRIFKAGAVHFHHHLKEISELWARQRIHLSENRCYLDTWSSFCFMLLPDVHYHIWAFCTFNMSCFHGFPTCFNIPPLSLNQQTGVWGILIAKQRVSCDLSAAMRTSRFLRSMITPTKYPGM